MAIIKFGAIVTDARGKLGGHYFNKAKGVATIATKPNAPSKYFYQKNKQFKSLCKVSIFWNSLNDNQRNQFNMFAGSRFFINKFGDKYTMSGRALFQKMYSLLFITNLNTGVFVMPSSVLIGIEYGQLSSGLARFTANTVVGSALFVVLKLVTSINSRLFDPTKFRYVATQVCTPTSVPFFVSQFLTAEESANISRLRVSLMLFEVNSSGWRSAPIIMRWVGNSPII